jgi:hypothetical protein
MRSSDGITLSMARVLKGAGWTSIQHLGSSLTVAGVRGAGGRFRDLNEVRQFVQSWLGRC